MGTEINHCHAGVFRIADKRIFISMTKEIMKSNWKGNWAKNLHLWALQISSVSLTADWFSRINIVRVCTSVCRRVSVYRVWSLDLLQLLSFFLSDRGGVRKGRFLANEILRELSRKDVGSRCSCNDKSTSPETNDQFSRVASLSVCLLRLMKQSDTE